jgi:hypothetical protein
MAHIDRRRLRDLYVKVRPLVEECCGPGSITEKKFAELCSRGAAQMKKATIERKKKDSLVAKLDELERRVRRLEGQLAGRK